MAGKIHPYLTKMSEIVHFFTTFQHNMSKIFDHLYIGAEEDATNINQLRDAGITHVVNCAEVYVTTSQEFYGDYIKYYGFEAEDDDEYDIMQHFEPVYDFIEEARTSGGKALVHCLMGVNRSAALCVAYTMVHKDVGPLTATSLVERSRGHILANENFQKQVVQFADERDLLSKDEEMLHLSKKELHQYCKQNHIAEILKDN